MAEGVVLVDGASWGWGRVVALLVEDEPPAEEVEGGAVDEPPADEWICDVGGRVLVAGAAVAGEFPATTAATPTAPVAPPATRTQVTSRARALPASALREVIGSLHL